MKDERIITPIAAIHTDFPTKFGVPRQSGIADNVSHIVFMPGYRDPDAVRGLSEFSHIWLIWGFSELPEQDGKSFSPTVRPPRLGGNRRVGVFATRSPFRPNSLGLSSLRLLSVEIDEKNGPVLTVEGADMVDGTPIYDIKPYVAYTDNHADAVSGFAEGALDYALDVEVPERLLSLIPEPKRGALMTVLSNDPRPSYHDDPERVYGFPFAGFEIKCRASGRRLTVTDVTAPDPGGGGGRR